MIRTRDLNSYISYCAFIIYFTGNVTNKNRYLNISDILYDNILYVLYID